MSTTYNKEDVKTFHEKGLMWFLLGSLISADSLIKFKDYETSIRILQKLVKSIPEADIEQEVKDQYYERAVKFLKLVQNEYDIKKKKFEKKKKYLEKHKNQQPKEIKVIDGKLYL